MDLGDVRIGVALSDPLGLTAQPVGFVAVRKDGAHFREIADLARVHEVAAIVVGLPLLMSGEEGDRAAGARVAARALQSLCSDYEVVLWDERLTTVQAERALIAGNVRRERRKRTVDAIAAAILLQSFLDSR